MNNTAATVAVASAPVRKVMQKRTFIKLAQAGKLVRTNGYHFDDHYGSAERVKNVEQPVHFCKEESDAVYDETRFNLKEWLVNMSQLRMEPNGDVFMRVHSNENHTFRILP